MNVAKFLYLGGKIIYANDKRLDYYSYKELGLPCPVCGEPVHLRKGESRKPYFAHFKGTDPKQVEECNFRVSGYGNTSQGTESNYIEDKGQRLEIFQKHFLEILTINNPNLLNGIGIIKQEINVKTGNLSITASNLEKLTSKCINWFVKNPDDSKELLIELHRNIYKNDSRIELRQQIVCEMFNYLHIKSSRVLLKDIVYFSIHKASMKLLKKFPDILFTYSGISIKSVKFELLEIIIRTPWLEAFSQINSLGKYEQVTDFLNTPIFSKKKYCIV